MLAKVFKNGRSQAVRIPKEYRFTCDEVIIDKIGDVVILIPKDKGWDIPNAETIAALNEFYKMEKNPNTYQKHSSFSDAMKDVLADDL